MQPTGWATTPAELLKLNVNDKTEKKGKLTYLSWAWAWQEALKADPKVNFLVHTFNNVPYMEINGTMMVWVTVTMFNKPVTCMLPVMNNYNKCITNPDAFDVNTTIMRCLTKAIALHGLGLYIYAGEDLPERLEDNDYQDAIEPQEQPPISGAEQAQADIEGLKLFANGIFDFIGYCESEPDLVSFWKNNQVQLDELKVALPEQYDSVVKAFKERKEQIKNG